MYFDQIFICLGPSAKPNCVTAFSPLYPTEWKVVIFLVGHDCTFAHWNGFEIYNLLATLRILAHTFSQLLSSFKLSTQWFMRSGGGVVGAFIIRTIFILQRNSLGNK